MTIDLDVLEGLAKAALALDCGNEGWFIPANFAKIMEPADAALCAAMSPTKVLSLIAAARERDGLREALTEISEIAALEDADDNISRDDFSRGVRAARLDVGRIARQALTQETQS